MHWNDYLTVAQYLSMSENEPKPQVTDSFCCDSGYSSVNHSRQTSYDVDCLGDFGFINMEPLSVPSPQPPLDLTSVSSALPPLNSCLSRLTPLLAPGRLSPSVYNYDKVGRTSPGDDPGYATLLTARSSGRMPDWSGHQPAVNRLCDELLLRVFSLLDCRQLSSCSRVCRRWNWLSRRPQLWRCITLDDSVDASSLLLQLSHNFSPAPQIEKLQLSHCSRVTDEVLISLAPLCTQLRHLQVVGCNGVSGAGISQLLAFCVHLERLELTSCQALTWLQLPVGLQLPRLSSVDLSDCQLLEDSSVRSILTAAPALQFLYLRRCQLLTDGVVACVAGLCAELHELSVSECCQLTNTSLRALSQLGSNLRYLSFARCVRIGDEGLISIARKCSRLRYVNARGCMAVSESGVAFLAQHCTRIRAIDLGATGVSDAALISLVDCCPRLAKLGLKACPLVTEIGICQLARYCPDLLQLNVQDTDFGVQAYRTVKKHCPQCVIEHTNPGLR